MEDVWTAFFYFKFKKLFPSPTKIHQYHIYKSRETSKKTLNL